MDEKGSENVLAGCSLDFMASVALILIILPLGMLNGEKMGLYSLSDLVYLVEYN